MPKRIRSPEQVVKRREASRVAMITKHRRLSPERKLLKGARDRSLRNKREFNLTIEDIVIPEYCPILGLKLKGSEGTPNSASPTLDRIDNSKGYTKDNVAVISHKANSHKENLTIEQVENLLKYMKKVSKINGN